MKTTLIDAFAFIAPDGDVVHSGLLAAAAIEDALERDGDVVVVVDCGRLKGASSSYFNVLLNSVAMKLGPEALSQRLRFEIPSTVVRRVFERSLEAALRPPAT